MARVSIYVSDELKARMAEAGDALNWSDIARPAFETALAAFNHRKGQNMQTAIERLRASKAHHEQEQGASAEQQGRDWAANRASYPDLKRMSEIDLDLFGNDVNHIWPAMRNAVDPEREVDDEDAKNHLFGAVDDPGEDWLIAFVKGVQEFYAEVEHQL